MVLTAPDPDSLSASAYPARWRWLQAGGFALAVHAMAWWLLLVVPWQTTEPRAETTVNVVLVPVTPAEPVPLPAHEPLPIESQPDQQKPVEPRPLEAAPVSPATVAAVAPLAPVDEQVEQETALAPAPPTVSSARLLAHISKYRLHDEKLLEDLPEEPPEPLSLGHINRQDLLAMLDKPLPNLPFADPDTPFVFYSTGFQGEVEKFFDKITKRTSHTTKWGTKIECAYTLIFVVCGYG